MQRTRSSGWRRKSQRRGPRARRVWQNSEPIGPFVIRPFIRLAAFTLVAFLAWYATPTFAGANSIPSITIGCDSVDVTWATFPERPVDLNVTVTQGDGTTRATVSTDGAPSGTASVPVKLADGPASASVSWTNQKEHTVGPVTADLHCTVATTTTTTVTTSTTVPPTSPPTTVPNDCGPGALACTGSNADYPIAVGGILLILGATFLALARPRHRAR